MSKIFALISVVAISLSIAFSGCSSKQIVEDNSYYDRANDAASESHKNF